MKKLDKKEYMRQWRSRNKERIKKVRHEWYLKHREEEIVYAIDYINNHPDMKATSDKKYREKNKQKISKQKHEFRINNIERVKEQERIGRLKHKEKKRIRDKKYGKDNRDKINRRTLLRLKTDINFKLAHYLRVRLGSAIKNQLKIIG